MLRVQVKLLDPKCRPVYSSRRAAGADLRARLEKPITLNQGDRMVIPTGVCISIPEDCSYYGRIAERSGQAAKCGLRVGGGVIDADYRGEIGVILASTDRMPVTIEPYERIAQIIFTPYEQAEFDFIEGELDATERGEGGFGHTGIK